MNYTKIYDKLMQRAFGRIRNDYDYMEQHHIKPRCLGGTDDDANLVWLTPEEHFVAHQLLVKLHPDNRYLMEAARLMTWSSSNQKRNNKMYGWLKARLYEQQSKERRGVTFEERFGKERADEIKEKLRTAAQNRAPQTEEHKRKNSEAQKKLDKSHLMKPVEVNGYIYPSGSEAARRLGVDRTTIQRWLKSGKAYYFDA